MTSKSSPLYSPNIIFNSLISILAVNPDLLNNQSRIGDQTIFNTWKNYFKKHLHCTLQTSHINENDKNKLELFRNNI
jgi:hypothetical protein